MWPFKKRPVPPPTVDTVDLEGSFQVFKSQLDELLAAVRKAPAPVRPTPPPVRKAPKPILTHSPDGTDYFTCSTGHNSNFKPGDTRRCVVCGEAPR